MNRGNLPIGIFEEIVFQPIIGIPMGTNVAPLFGDLQCYSYNDAYKMLNMPILMRHSWLHIAGAVQTLLSSLFHICSALCVLLHCCVLPYAPL